MLEKMPWVCLINVSIINKNIDTYFPHVDAIDTSFRQQPIQLYVQVESFLTDPDAAQDSDLVQFLEILSDGLAFGNLKALRQGVPPMTRGKAQHSAGILSATDLFQRRAK